MPPRRHGPRANNRAPRAADAQNDPVYDMSPDQHSVMVESQNAPLQADGAIWVDAAHRLVASTACLGWKTVPSVRGNTVSDAKLTSAQAVSSFLSRCFVEDTQPSRDAAERAHLLNFRLSASAWSRILSVYYDSGLAEKPLPDLPTFRKAISNLVLARPQDLAITQADWNLGADFNLPAGNGAADVEAKEILAPLRFLSMATAVKLEIDSKPASRFGVLSSLIGAIGPCLTDASRRDETSPLHYVAHRIRQVAGVGVRDGALAFNLPDTILSAALPDPLQPLLATPNDLMNELIDALSYTTSAAQRETIEEKRVFLLGRR